MKRILYLIITSSLLFSCAKEYENLKNVSSLDTPGIKVTGIVSSGNTRTEYESYGSDGLLPRLKTGDNGDEIGIYTVYEDRKGNLKANTNLHFKATGTYTVNNAIWALFEAQSDYSDKLELGDEVFAYYPYSASELTVIGETTRADFPTSNGWDGTRTMIISEKQTMASGSLDHIGIYCPLIAKPTTIQDEDGEMRINLKFTNPFAVAKIGIRNRLESQESITVTGLEWCIPGQDLTGKFGVDLTANDPATVVPQAKEAEDQVEVVFSDNPTVGYGEALYAYVVIAPCSQPEVTVTVHTTKGDYVRTVNSPSVKEFRRGYLDSQIIGISGENKVLSDSETPLCLEAIEDGTITISNPLGLTIEYSKDMSSWTPTAESEISVTVSSGEEVYLQGNNDSYSDGTNHTTIHSTGKITVYGNVMSLINSTDFRSLTTLPGSHTFEELFYNNNNLYSNDSRNIILPATSLTESCYRRMFALCDNYSTVPELPALSLAERCYDSMFWGCAITTAPELPSTEMKPFCYNAMFRRCQLLTTPPELPSTSLDNYCYSYMFLDCTALNLAPELPATLMQMGCYHDMFENCTSLKTAPVLPAEILAPYCYNGMFSGCSNINYIKMMATDIFVTSGSSIINNIEGWTEGVAQSGTFVKSENATWEVSGPDGVPEGWIIKIE